MVWYGIVYSIISHAIPFPKSCDNVFHYAAANGMVAMHVQTQPPALPLCHLLCTPCKLSPAGFGLEK